WRGSHSVKAGGSLTYDVTTQRYQPNQNGIYFYRGGPDVAPLPFQFNQSFALDPQAVFMHPKAYVLGSFVQDDWRARSNLTLNFGLRYDVEIVRDIPHWPAPTDKNNVDPRVGFAWDPMHDQKWSVRGGFGGFPHQPPSSRPPRGPVDGRAAIATRPRPHGAAEC